MTATMVEGAGVRSCRASRSAGAGAVLGGGGGAARVRSGLGSSVDELDLRRPWELSLRRALAREPHQTPHRRVRLQLNLRFNLSADHQFHLQFQEVGRGSLLCPSLPPFSQFSPSSSPLIFPLIFPRQSAYSLSLIPHHTFSCVLLPH